MRTTGREKYETWKRSHMFVERRYLIDANWNCFGRQTCPFRCTYSECSLDEKYINRVILMLDGPHKYKSLHDMQLPRGI